MAILLPALANAGQAGAWKWKSFSKNLQGTVTGEAAEFHGDLTAAERKELFYFKGTYKLPIGSTPAQKELRAKVEARVNRAFAYDWLRVWTSGKAAL